MCVSISGNNFPLIFIMSAKLIVPAYDALRNKIMEAERMSSLGGNLWLSSAEEKANSILMNAKKEEVNE